MLSSLCSVHTGSDANIYFAQYDCLGDEGALLSCVTEEFKPSQCVQSAYVGLTCDGKAHDPFWWMIVSLSTNRL